MIVEHWLNLVFGCAPPPKYFVPQVFVHDAHTVSSRTYLSLFGDGQAKSGLRRRRPGAPFCRMYYGATEGSRRRQRLPYSASSTRATIASNQEATLGQSIVVYRFLGLRMWFVILTHN